MVDAKGLDPYAGNILTKGLGPILSREQATARMTFLPTVPGDISGVPKHIRMHYLVQLRDLHIPSLEGGRLVETVDLIVRPSYRYRDPRAPQTWSVIGNEPLAHKTPRAPAGAAVAVGHSGTGKTEAILRGFNCYPQQVVLHDNFPHMARGLAQMVWLSADVPASGGAVDLARSLMRAWDAAMAAYLPNVPSRFFNTLEKAIRDKDRMLDEWRQVAASHFLGILHLDEVQNFFKLQTLEKRRSRKNPEGGLELSIVEDQCLKWILTLTNTWQIGLLLSGTPDGVGALTKRLSNVQRFVTSGFHRFPHFESADDPFFASVVFPQLLRYQLVKHPLPNTPGLANLIIELSGGILRIIVALWVAAHRIAFERNADDLRVEDFRRAAATYLAPVGPAVTALRSRDPKLMSRYEDMIVRDDGYWSTFWNSMVST